MRLYDGRLASIRRRYGSLLECANGFTRLGFNRDAATGEWIYREWAPGARALYLIGDFNGWNRGSHPMQQNREGVWELRLPADALQHGQHVKVHVVGADNEGRDRIPAWIRYTEQNPQTFDYSGIIWSPEEPYKWKNARWNPANIKVPFIYETHIGMAGEQERIHTYREFADDETLPIGGPFPNTEIILLDENDKVPAVGQQGEICVRGTRLTLGYYRNPEKTAEAFVQNPLNKLYPELIYRTGDLGKLNQRGELEFAGRKDYQIKHMGHRIELGEIEVIVNMHPQVRSACCIFDDVKKKIVLYYTGDLSVAEVTDYIKSKLPRYMIPNVTKQLEQLPLTPNGKIDRKLLKSLYEQK